LQLKGSGREVEWVELGMGVGMRRQSWKAVPQAAWNGAWLDQNWARVVVEEAVVLAVEEGGLLLLQLLQPLLPLVVVVLEHSTIKTFTIDPVEF
jgi:hypothetical protein